MEIESSERPEEEEHEDINLIYDHSNYEGSRLTPRAINGRWILGLTLFLEAITLFFRFGLHLQSTRDTAKLGTYTFGIRIHHGYLGVPLIFAKRRYWCIRIGWALICSDLIHHFLVLWPTTGSPQFDLIYPRNATKVD